MALLEKLWVLINILIVLIILLTDPKTSSLTGTWSNQISSAFVSASDGQKFIKQFNWILIATFFLLTVLLSYMS